MTQVQRNAHPLAAVAAFATLSIGVLGSHAVQEYAAPAMQPAIQRFLEAVPTGKGDPDNQRSSQVASGVVSYLGGGLCCVFGALAGIALFRAGSRAIRTTPGQGLWPTPRYVHDNSVFQGRDAVIYGLVEMFARTSQTRLPERVMDFLPYAGLSVCLGVAARRYYKRPTLRLF